MAMVTLRYWAAAKEAAGIAEEAVSAGTLAEALAVATADAGDGDGDGGPAGLAVATADVGDGGPAGQARTDRRDQRSDRNARLRTVLVRSSFLVDGTPVGTRAPEAVVLGDGAVVEVLPPFAGG